jgi:hypothetical protein
MHVLGMAAVGHFRQPSISRKTYSITPIFEVENVCIVP